MYIVAASKNSNTFESDQIFLLKVYMLKEKKNRFIKEQDIQQSIFLSFVNMDNEMVKDIGEALHWTGEARWLVTKARVHRFSGMPFHFFLTWCFIENCTPCSTQIPEHLETGIAWRRDRRKGVEFWSKVKGGRIGDRERK